jgi:hypothetical protein
MGLSGTDAAREAADMMLLDDNFASIVAAIEEGRAVFANIRKFLTYILTSNIPELVPYLAFVLLRIPLPLTVIQMLAVDLGTNIFPALALGAEKPGADIMQQAPRQRRTPAEQRPDRPRLLLPRPAGSRRRPHRVLLRPRPGALAVRHRPGQHRSAVPERNLGLLRLHRGHPGGQRLPLPPPRRPSFGAGFTSNPMLFCAIGVELSLLAFVLYTPGATCSSPPTPLPASVWPVAIGCALAMLLLEETRKGLVRRWGRPGRCSGAGIARGRKSPGFAGNARGF